jgi:hypothetical protein
MPKAPPTTKEQDDPVKETIKTKKEKHGKEAASRANIERPKVCSEQGSFCILLVSLLSGSKRSLLTVIIAT